ncbi:MAG: 30S ribosomal protein S2 [Methanobacteriota archaeon]|nr:MAG: 30S ribosomal protein S2 [Euryarchaeota archaeon]
MEEKIEGLLLPVERYLESGIHIGTKLKNGETSKYIYKKRKDGIYVLSLEQIDEGIRKALEEVKKYNLKDICIVATRTYAANAATKCKKFLPEISIITKRFIPGTLTNPESRHFMEPGVMLVCDPRTEKEAIREANMTSVPVIALVDTDTLTKGISTIVPMNNKGRKSLGLFFWLLTRELMLKEGKIKGYDEFQVPINYFERFELEESE